MCWSKEKKKPCDGKETFPNVQNDTTVAAPKIKLL